MIAVDWSHNKGLTVYDGKKLSVVDRKAFTKRLERTPEARYKNNTIEGGRVLGKSRPGLN